MVDSFDKNKISLRIAKQRFPFPNEEKPAWRTYVNDGSNSSPGLSTVDGDVHPDILVIDRATTTNKYLMAASVCVDKPSSEDVIIWRQISNVVDSFYVFVPKGYCREAAKLAGAGKVLVSGFRQFNLAGESIEINDCF